MYPVIIPYMAAATDLHPGQGHHHGVPELRLPVSG